MTDADKTTDARAARMREILRLNGGGSVGTEITETVYDNILDAMSAFAAECVAEDRRSRSPSEASGAAHNGHEPNMWVSDCPACRAEAERGQIRQRVPRTLAPEPKDWRSVPVTAGFMRDCWIEYGKPSDEGFDLSDVIERLAKDRTNV